MKKKSKKKQKTLELESPLMTYLRILSILPPEGTAVLPSPRGTRIQTAPLVPGSGPENNREVHSSPPVVS